MKYIYCLTLGLLLSTICQADICGYGSAENSPCTCSNGKQGTCGPIQIEGSTSLRFCNCN